MATTLDKYTARAGFYAAIVLILYSPVLLAMSEWLINLEPYVKEASFDRAIMSHVLVYDHSGFGQEEPGQISASFEIENGASILSDFTPQMIPQDEYYLPIDMELGFSEPGVFMGSIIVEVQFGQHQILERRYFWIQHTEADTVLISYDEYLKRQRLEAESRRKPPEPYLNLEADDVPGEAKSKVPGCVVDAVGGVSCQE